MGPKESRNALAAVIGGGGTGNLEHASRLAYIKL